MIGERPQLRGIDKHLLKVDPRYQRGLDSARSKKIIEKITAEFNWLKFQVITVTKDMNIVDGQHRHAAAMARDDVTDVPCLMLPTEDVAEAAALFVAINRERIALTPLMVFKAELAAKTPEALEIVKVCLQAGAEPLVYTIAGAKPNQLMAISTLRAQVRADPERATIALRAAVRSGVGLTAVVLQCAYRAASFGQAEDDIVTQLQGMRGVSLNTGAHSEFKRADVFFKMMTGELDKPAPKPVLTAPAPVAKGRKPFQFKRDAVVEPKALPVEVRGNVPVRRFEAGSIESLLEKTFAGSRVKYERWISKKFVCKLDGVPTTLADAIARADAIRFKANLPPIGRKAEARA